MLPRLGPKRNPFVSSKPPAAQRPCAFLKRKEPRTPHSQEDPPFSPHKLRKDSPPARRERRRRAAAGRPFPSTERRAAKRAKPGEDRRTRTLCPASLPPPCTPLSGSLVPLHGVPHAQQAFFHNGAGHGQIQPHKACGAAHKQAVAALPKGTHQRYLFSAFSAGLRKARGDGETAGSGSRIRHLVTEP